MPDAYSWSATSDPSAATLHDLRSGWSVVVRRPSDDRLPIDSLVRLEPLALSWGNLLEQNTVHTTLHRWLEADPRTVLRGSAAPTFPRHPEAAASTVFGARWQRPVRYPDLARAVCVHGLSRKGGGRGLGRRLRG